MFAKIVLVTLFGISACHGAYLMECPSAPLPTEVRANYCEGDFCLISISGKIFFEMDAYAPWDVTYFDHKLEFVSGGDILIPVQLYGAACDALTVGSCPLTGGVKFTYKMNVDWTPYMVGVGNLLMMRFTLYDHGYSSVFCFQVPVEIVA